MDPGGGVRGTDSSGNSRTASLTAITQTPKKYGNALAFNGTTSRMAAPSMAFTNAFTLEAWSYFQVSGLRSAPQPAPPKSGPSCSGRRRAGRRSSMRIRMCSFSRKPEGSCTALTYHCRLATETGEGHP